MQCSFREIECIVQQSWCVTQGYGGEKDRFHGIYRIETGGGGGHSVHLDSYDISGRGENLQKEIQHETTGTESAIIYIDPESNTLRSYYPDFLAQKKDGSYVIIEVKGENMIDNAVVQAKARSAAELAAANAMTYEMIPSLKATYGLHQLHEVFL